MKLILHNHLKISRILGIFAALSCILISVFLIIWFFFPELKVQLYEKFVVSREEVYLNTELTTELAIQSNDPGLCNNLSKREKLIHSYKGNFFQKEVRYTGFDINYPRRICLQTYFKKTLDASACEMIYKIYSPDIDDKMTQNSYYRDGERCYTFAAETYSDQSYCESIRNPWMQDRCKALALLDHTKCPKSSLDPAKFDGFCVADVVYRTKQYQSCFDIDQNEPVKINRCIQGAMYGEPPTQMGGRTEIVKWLCEYMVDDGSDYHYAENCLEQRLGQSSVRVPLRLDKE